MPFRWFRPPNSLTLSCAAGGRAATRIAAGWLPRLNVPRRERDATNVTPSEYCSAKGGSAARPNTGRDGFSVELGGTATRRLTSLDSYVTDVAQSTGLPLLKATRRYVALDTLAPLAATPNARSLFYPDSYGQPNTARSDTAAAVSRES
jgi:hypothetical protein